MKTWKVNAVFPDEQIAFSCEKEELIEKFSKYLPSIAMDYFKSFWVAIGDFNLSITP
jgi:hypothetical protein